ncbi:EutN/CcmL family microcompartment protein [Marinisporobacter balticus]|uniref:Ethanolamine utilization protein EutN n=1 Tax=Marinisporobacter balticus TaxID=2018667 RepID=A0A4R2L2H1_9FIRM|nr:EutN/CcmL family microcompartment protein [Marinisporobacter balticus]TCO77956.1 ethanolamine utilization protein EutN [Marinisporobacter balticus]
MYLAKVIGVVVATHKVESLKGEKILLVQPIDTNEHPTGNSQVVIDAVGAGAGEVVLIATGSSARKVFGNNDTPIDASIVGIVEHVEVTG